MRKLLAIFCLFASACWDLAAGTQYMLIGYGQSLSIGNWGCGVISIMQPYPSNNFMMLNGTGTSLLPLTETGSDFGGNACSGLSTWSASVSYLAGAVVSNGGVTYKAIAFNTNQAPPNATYWQSVASYQESPLSSAVNNTTFLDPAHAFGAIANGYGQQGQPISALWRGTGHYTDMMNGVTEANTLAHAIGNNLVVVGVMFTEGEQDFQNGSTTYYADSMTLQSEVQADIQAITGQSALVPFFYSQLSSEVGGSISGGQMATCPDGLQACIGDSTGAAALANSDKVPIAQWRLAHDYPNLFYMTGPKYQYPYGEAALHLSNRGYNMLGATTARALKCVYVDQASNCVAGVYPSTIYISGNVITLTTVTPNGLPLTSAVMSGSDVVPMPYPYRNGQQDQNGLGFQVFQTINGTQSSVPITNVSVSGQKAIITLGATPAGTNIRLAYAFEGQRYSLSPTLNCAYNATSCNGNTLIGTVGSQGALHGNIRTMADYTDLNGDPVYHWLVHFNEPVLQQPSGAVISGGVCAGCTF